MEDVFRVTSLARSYVERSLASIVFLVNPSIDEIITDF